MWIYQKVYEYVLARVAYKRQRFRVSPTEELNAQEKEKSVTYLWKYQEKPYILHAF